MSTFKSHSQTNHPVNGKPICPKKLPWPTPPKRIIDKYIQVTLQNIFHNGSSLQI